MAAFDSPFVVPFNRPLTAASLHASSKAIYSTRLNLFRNATGAIVNIGVETPLQVLRVGQSVSGVGAITNFALHDSVNRDGVVATWVAAGAAGATKAIVTATPTTRVLLDAATGGPNQAFINTINGRGRSDPDSLLVDQAVRLRIGTQCVLPYVRNEIHV